MIFLCVIGERAKLDDFKKCPDRCEIVCWVSSYGNSFKIFAERKKKTCVQLFSEEKCTLNTKVHSENLIWLNCKASKVNSRSSLKNILNAHIKVGETCSVYFWWVLLQRSFLGAVLYLLFSPEICCLRFQRKHLRKFMDAFTGSLWIKLYLEKHS